jgi:hypothetical protein
MPRRGERKQGRTAQSNSSMSEIPVTRVLLLMPMQVTIAAPAFARFA